MAENRERSFAIGVGDGCRLAIHEKRRPAAALPAHVVKYTGLPIGSGQLSHSAALTQDLLRNAMRFLQAHGLVLRHKIRGHFFDGGF